MTPEFPKTEWGQLYRLALLELEHSLMAGRILEARDALQSRVEALSNIPGLHREERIAIQDALNNLRVLERMEAEHATDAKRKAEAVARAALEKLLAIAPKIEKLESAQD